MDWVEVEATLKLSSGFIATKPGSVITDLKLELTDYCRLKIGKRNLELLDKITVSYQD